MSDPDRPVPWPGCSPTAWWHRLANGSRRSARTARRRRRRQHDGRSGSGRERAVGHRPVAVVHRLGGARRRRGLADHGADPDHGEGSPADAGCGSSPAPSCAASPSTHEPIDVAVEGPAYGSDSLLSAGMARAAVEIALVNHVPREVAPSSLKFRATGDGCADKAQMMAAAFQLVRYEGRSHERGRRCADRCVAPSRPIARHQQGGLMATKAVSEPELGEFEHRPIARTNIKVTNAGDGLSQALKVDPQILHHGDTVHVVLECLVAKVTLEPLDDEGDELVRVHVLKAGSAAIVDEALVADAIADQQERIRKARQEEEGIQEPFDDEDDE